MGWQTWLMTVADYSKHKLDANLRFDQSLANKQTVTNMTLSLVLPFCHFDRIQYCHFQRARLETCFWNWAIYLSFCTIILNLILMCSMLWTMDILDWSHSKQFTSFLCYQTRLHHIASHKFFLNSPWIQTKFIHNHDNVLCLIYSQLSIFTDKA